MTRYFVKRCFKAEQLNHPLIDLAVHELDCVDTIKDSIYDLNLSMVHWQQYWWINQFFS